MLHFSSIVLAFCPRENDIWVVLGSLQGPLYQNNLLGIRCYVLVADSVMPETRNDRRKRQCTRASSPHQHVHQPRLKTFLYDTYSGDDSQQHSEGSRLLEETMMPVADGRKSIATGGMTVVLGKTVLVC